MSIGDGAPPIINWQMGVVDGLNRMRRFICHVSSTVRLVGIECRLPTALANTGLGIASATRIMFATWPAAAIQISLDNCLVTGGMAATKLGIIACIGGSTGIIGLNNTTLNRPIVAVANNPGGLALIARAVLTLAGGAVLSDGGTLGTNYFANQERSP